MRNGQNIKVVEGNGFTLVCPIVSRSYVSGTPIDTAIDATQLSNVVVKLNGVEWPSFSLENDGVFVGISASIEKNTYNVEITGMLNGKPMRTAYFEAFTIVSWNEQSNAEEYMSGSDLVITLPAAYILGGSIVDEITAVIIAATEQLQGDNINATLTAILSAVLDITGYATAEQLTQAVAQIIGAIPTDYATEANATANKEALQSAIEGVMTALSTKAEQSTAKSILDNMFTYMTFARYLGGNVSLVKFREEDNPYTIFYGITNETRIGGNSYVICRLYKTENNHGYEPADGYYAIQIEGGWEYTWGVGSEVYQYNASTGAVGRLVGEVTAVSRAWNVGDLYNYIANNIKGADTTATLTAIAAAIAALPSVAQIQDGLAKSSELPTDYAKREDVKDGNDTAIAMLKNAAFGLAALRALIAAIPTTEPATPTNVSDAAAAIVAALQGNDNTATLAAIKTIVSAITGYATETNATANKQAILDAIALLATEANATANKNAIIAAIPTDYAKQGTNSGATNTAIKEQVDNIAANMYGSWYGIEWDVTSSSPSVTRIGNTALHKSLPIQSRMRGCLLNDNGDVVKYLDANDWTGETRDGSQGQVMVEIPEHYRKFETDGNMRRVKLSEYQLAGYHKVPKVYCSAYEAALDRTNNKLASVVNMDAQYRGGNNTSGWDGTYRSLLGMPATSISRTNYRTYARNRKANSTEWNCYVNFIHEEIYYLFMVEYATRNSQATYNAALDVNGYHQGGLGVGVSEMPSWGDYNSYNPIVPCGASDTLGNRTGVVDHIVLASDGTSTHYTAKVPRYRGIENPFGHVWKHTDGINVMIKPATDAEPTSDVYTCKDPSAFNDSNYNGYTMVGHEARNDGYVKNIIFGEEGCIMPTEVGGGSSSYFCDYHYTNIPSATTLRGVLFGGDASSGSYGGFACARSHYAPSYAYSHIGSRLCFIPAQA